MRASHALAHRGIQALAVGEVAVEDGLGGARHGGDVVHADPGTVRRMARRVASTSSCRRVARCWSQRVLRPSPGAVGVGAHSAATVAGTCRTCYLRYPVPDPSEHPWQRPPTRGARPASTSQPLRAAPPSSAATASRSRARTARTPRPPTRTCSPPRSRAWWPGSGWPGSGRRGGRRRRAQAQPRLQPHPRGGARLVARGDHARLRRPAGLRDRARGGDPRRQQDRPRPGRVRHRRGRRLRVRRPDRRERGAARGAARAQPRQDPGQRAKALGRSAPRSAGPGDPAQRRAAHRPVDGRAHGA